MGEVIPLEQHSNRIQRLTTKDGKIMGRRKDQIAVVSDQGVVWLDLNQFKSMVVDLELVEKWHFILTNLRLGVILAVGWDI